MTDKINPVEARALREAFREVGDKVEKGVKITRKSATNSVEIIAPMTGGPKDRLTLVIKDGDTVLAMAPIDNGVLRRLKREMGFWRSVHSGSAKAFRHQAR